MKKILKHALMALLILSAVGCTQRYFLMGKWNADARNLLTTWSDRI